LEKELKDGNILESHIKDVQKSAALLAKMVVNYQWLK